MTSERRFAALSIGVLLYSLVVIAWGYFLRISESGDGCGDDWPLCAGSFVPQAAQFPTWVEYTHRVSSGLVLLLVLLMAVWAYREFRRGHPLRRVAVASFVFTVTESLFGALLVVFGWVALDVSLGRVLIRPFHVVNTFLLLACLGLTAWWAWRGIDRLEHRDRAHGRSLIRVAVAFLILAATGSWTGLAGTAFPTGSLAEGLGQYLDPAHLLIYLRTIHPALAVAVVGLLARLVWRTWQRAEQSGERTRVERRLVTAIAALASAQLAVGPLTIALLHPTALRLLHLVLVDFLWLAVVFLWALGMEARGFTPARSYSARRESSQSRPGAARP